MKIKFIRMVIIGFILNLFVYYAEAKSLIPDTISINTNYARMQISDRANSYLDKNMLEQSRLPVGPLCSQTNNSEHSWIIIDLRAVTYGLMKVKLFGDMSKDDNYLWLENIKIEMALYMKDYQDLNNPSNKWKLCAEVNSVDPNTRSANIFCKQPINARWVKISRNGSLRLCRVNIFQTEVKRNCYATHPMKYTDNFKIDTFSRSLYVSHKRCAANCAKKAWCQAYRYYFTINNPNTGDCEFMKVTYIKNNTDYQRLCPSKYNKRCVFKVNRCNIGKSSARLGPVIPFEIFNLKSDNNGRKVVSMRLNGNTGCVSNTCGMIEIFVINSTGKGYFCNKLDTRIYQYLNNFDFLCLKPIPNPAKVILIIDKSKFNTSFMLDSILIRTIRSNEYPILFPDQYITTTSITTISPSSTSSPSSPSSSYSIYSSNHTETTETKSTTETMVLDKDERPSTLTENITTKSTITIASSFTTSRVMSIKELDKSYANKKSNSVKNETSIQIPITTDNATIKTYSIVRNASSHFLGLWIIIGLTIVVFIVVILIGIILSSAQRKKKKKEWDLPDGGLCPPMDPLLIHDNAYDDINIPASLASSSVIQMNTSNGGQSTQTNFTNPDAYNDNLK